MTIIELFFGYVGFWGLILALTTMVENCNAWTAELVEYEMTCQQGQACGAEASDEPEQWGTIPSL
jgi:hypothetical protein